MNSSIKGIGSSPIQPQISSTDTSSESQSPGIQKGFDSNDRIESGVQNDPFSNSALLQQDSNLLEQIESEKSQLSAKLKTTTAAQEGKELASAEALQKASEAKEQAQLWDAIALGPERRAAGQVLGQAEEGAVNIAHWIAEGTDQAGKVVSQFVQDPVNSGSKAAQAVADAAEKAAEDAEKAAEDAAKAAAQAAQDAVQAVEQEVEDIANQAEQAAEDAANAAAQAAQDALNAAENAGSDAVDDVKKIFGF